MKFRVIFYNSSIQRAGNSVFGKDVVFGQFFISMC